MKFLLRYFLAVLVGGFFATGCAPAQAALDELRASAAAAEHANPTPTLSPTGELEPAPASYTQAQAKAYYLAQLKVQREATPRKVKNSNNVSQQIHAGPSTWQLSLAAGLVLVMGVVIGFLAAQRLKLAV